MSLSGTWPAILYDEGMVNNGGDDDSELTGLFRSETLLRVRLLLMYLSYLVLSTHFEQCAITVLCGPSAGRLWTYPEPGARSFASSQKDSNAEINGIRRITPEVVAYISTLVRRPIHYWVHTKIHLLFCRPSSQFTTARISPVTWEASTFPSYTTTLSPYLG